MNRSLSNCVPYLNLTFICVLVWVMMMFLGGFAPFGDLYAVNYDNIYCIINLNGLIERIWNGTESLTFSFASAGIPRHSFVPSGMDLFSPATWLSLLFSPSDDATCISWVLLFQMWLCSISCYFYLSHTFRKVASSVLVLLAFSYAFSRILFMSIPSYSLYTPAILFPLFLFSLDRILKKRQWGLYVVILTFALGGCTYFAWMFCLFASLYALCYAGTKERRPALVLLAFATLGALALSSVLWLPSIELVSSSARASKLDSGWFPLLKSLDLIGAWSIPPAAVVLIVLSVRRWRNNRYALSLAALCACMVLKPVDLVWHMGEPVGASGRYCYMLAMMACCYAASVWRGKSHVMNYKRIFTVALLLGWIVLALRSEWKFSNKISFGTSIALICILFVASRLFFRWYIALSACALAAALCAIATLKGTQFGVLANQLHEGGVLPQAVSKQLHQSGQCNGEFYRVSGKGQFNPNFAESSGLYGISNFFHTCSSTGQCAYGNLGYYMEHTMLQDEGGTLFSDSFMGIRYFCSPVAHDTFPTFAKIQGFDDKALYRNPYYWGVGVLCQRPTSVPESETLNNDLWKYQNDFFRALGGAGDILREVEDVTVVAENGQHRILLGNLQGKSLIYTDLPMSCSGWGDDAIVTVAGKEKRPVNGYCKNIPLSLLPTIKGRTVQPAIDAEYPPDLNEQSHFFQLDEHLLSRFADNQRERVKVSQTGRSQLKIEATTQGDENYLVLPFVYLNGYNVEIEGVEVAAENCMGFLGIPLPEGEAGKTKEIVLSYEHPWSIVAKTISALALIVVLSLILFHRNPFAYPRVLGTAGYYMIFVFWACILVLYPLACVWINYPHFF